MLQTSNFPAQQGRWARLAFNRLPSGPQRDEVRAPEVVYHVTPKYICYTTCCCRFAGDQAGFGGVCFDAPGRERC